ncbi:DUF4132 domain-containing protein [Burkholderia cenocepacia]|uniref:DUF4132 domain-containing protein n=3 Tax=Burkholderia cenocepacia TaxID=95486 RepID=A0ABD4UCR7_9BURK|nr:DUF4132 domain-containing protein [Burkholderia cenocepacia]MBR7944724.1 DUF4132 domain-containing protein [Burkholderia cenocepacia]MBR8267692.1 DUF4132 domain-containing protein [Burkholderia cenocepacia]MBR8407284.1 DUF4132 domain-containing protein [Burkholderia cenocepacia]MCO8322508.1 DUF4132 domain-containing protein [Burkholderia cenocepacia]MCO8329793.1 DUF4132 domain-containing protein [Burkholderia cenocepacia]
MADRALVALLVARLTDPAPHAGAIDEPIDLSALDAPALGTVWPALRRVEHEILVRDQAFGDPRAEFARTVHRQIDALGLVPLIDADAALELFRAIPAGGWKRALEDLPCLDALPSPALQAELARIASEPEEGGLRAASAYAAYALDWFAGRRDFSARRAACAQALADSPFRVRELDVLPELGAAALLALAATNDGYFAPKRLWLDLSDPAVTLAEEAAYVAFARDALTEAARQVAALHAGAVPYEADRAFTTDDAQVLSRAARVAAYRDEAWLRPLIGPLLTGVCVAPTVAKTAPSQSLAIALGHAIETIPTPEGVRALRDALAVVRHAGVQKKLARNLKPAERALGERPRTALRMTLDAQPDKKSLAMLATCMETGFWQPLTLGHAEWRERLVDAPAGAAFSARMIWQARRGDGSTQSFTPDIAKGKVVLRDAAGRACEIADDCEIRLWHPLLADADERLAWQRAIVGRSLRQPVRQAFREYYVPSDDDASASDSAMFEGHVLSSRPLLGVARREGWSIRAYDDALVREFGDVRATFRVDARLYPGSESHGTSRRLHFERRHGARWLPLPIGEIDRVVFSEAARAVDLLVSVSAFALDDDATRAATASLAADPVRLRELEAERWQRLNRLSDLPLGVMAQHRKHVLSLVFAEPVAQGKITIDERHVRVGAWSVHCATGRVTRDGEPVEPAIAPPPSPLRAVPWLPYDEALLQRIVDVVAGLLD